MRARSPIRSPAAARQTFGFLGRDGGLASVEIIPAPHEFDAVGRIGADPAQALVPRTGGPGPGHDNNMRAAILHVIAAVIVGPSLAYVFGCFSIRPPPSPGRR